MGTGFFDSMAQGIFGGPSGTGQAPQVDPSQMNASLASENAGPDQGNQQAAENLMLQSAQGKGPSAAQAMLNQQTAQTGANANALAASGSGSSGQGLARRQAMMTGANATQQLGGQAAAARSAEQLGAQQNLGQLATAGRGQTIGQGQGNAQIQNQLGLGNAQLQAGQNQLNQQGQEFNAQQGSNLAGSIAGALGGALASDAGVKDDIRAADLDMGATGDMVAPESADYTRQGNENRAATEASKAWSRDFAKANPWFGQPIGPGLPGKPGAGDRFNRDKFGHGMSHGGTHVAPGNQHSSGWRDRPSWFHDMDLQMPMGGKMGGSTGQQPSLANANMSGKTGNPMQPVGGGGWQGPTGPGGGGSFGDMDLEKSQNDRADEILGNKRMPGDTRPEPGQAAYGSSGMKGAMMGSPGMTGLGGGMPSFGDAELKEPGGPAHVTLREEPFGLLMKNHMTGQLEKVATSPLSRAERHKALGPHGAGNINSPNRDRTVVSDLDVGDDPDTSGLNWGPPAHEAPAAGGGQAKGQGPGESQTGTDRTASGSERLGHALTNFGSGLTGKPMGMQMPGEKPAEKKEQSPGGSGLSPLASMFSKPASTAGAPKPTEGTTQGADIDLAGSSRHLQHETPPHVPGMHIGPSTYRDMDLGRDRQAPEEQHYTRQGNETRKFGPTHNYRQQLMHQLDESDEQEKQERAAQGTIKGGDVDLGKGLADIQKRHYPRPDPGAQLRASVADDAPNRHASGLLTPQGDVDWSREPMRASTDVGPKSRSYAGALRGRQDMTPDKFNDYGELPMEGGGAILARNRTRGPTMVSAHDIWRMQNGLAPEHPYSPKPGTDSLEAQMANTAAEQPYQAQHAMEDTRIDQLLAQQASRGRRGGMGATYTPSATPSYNQHAYDEAEGDPDRQRFLGHELAREGSATGEETWRGGGEPKPWEADEWEAAHPPPKTPDYSNDPTSRFIAGVYGNRR